MQDWQVPFDARGYVVLKGAIDAKLVASAKALADTLWARWEQRDLDVGASGARILERDRPDGGKTLDAIQGGHRAFSDLQMLRSDPALRDLLAARIGHDIVSVVDTLFFKPPAQTGTGIAFHRDAQFRRPADQYRDLETAYVQVGIPLERHGVENGGLILVPNSHVDLSLDATQVRSVRGVDDLASTLDLAGMETVSVEMEPGDLVLWHPHTIHGSPPNRSETHSRRFFVVGYMAAASCDAGDPV